MPGKKCVEGCECGRHYPSEERKKKLSQSGQGHIVSEKTRQKIRQANLGHSAWNKEKTGIYSLETRKKMGDHPNKTSEGAARSIEAMRQSNLGGTSWNKGHHSIYIYIFDRMTLSKWRQCVFSRDKYTCQICGQYGGVELNADHIKAKFLRPDLVYTVSNGRTLCVPCHKETDNYGRKAPRRPKVIQLPLPMVI